MKTFSISLFLIRTYQIVLSPFLGGRCRYYPSCSNYAIDCYKEHDTFSATWLVTKRVCSCHPFIKNKNYYDPAPRNLKGAS